MRLRQVVIAADKLDPVVENFNKLLGLKVAYRDPLVAHYGLVNAVMPVGGEFLEVVQPTRDDASAARYLPRRGGDAGYMVILQDGDAVAQKRRLEAMGARSVDHGDTAEFTYTHYHPADFTGVLASIDTIKGVADWQAPQSDWPYAGPDWRAHQPDSGAGGIRAVTIAHPDPQAAAARWAELLEAPVAATPQGPEVRLERGAIRFVAPGGDGAAGVIGFDIAASKPDAIRATARNLGLPFEGLAPTVGGVALNLVAA
jgi:hypothetical protein